MLLSKQKMPKINSQRTKYDVNRYFYCDTGEHWENQFFLLDTLQDVLQVLISNVDLYAQYFK